MRVDQFQFELPEELIAQTPLPDRAASRLLAYDMSADKLVHSEFHQITRYLRPGDALVLNDTRVLPARLFGVKRDTGAKAELLLLKALSGDRWQTLVRPGKKLRKGAIIDFGGEPGAPELTAHVEEEGEMGERVVQFSYKGIFNEILDRLGQMPLPPYIKEQLAERDRYQTVFAKHDGSAAAPTAGLHFTEALLDEIRASGVHITYITLHVGLGTFRPVSAETVDEHTMHEEYYRLSAETADVLNATRASGGKIVAVGTTSCRTLESAAAQLKDGEPLRACEGWTDIFIYPGYRFRVIDALLTNFHLPGSTLMMLVSALAGTERIREMYSEAIRERYRFFSFGDAMLLY